MHEYNAFSRIIGLEKPSEESDILSRERWFKGAKGNLGESVSLTGKLFDTFAAKRLD